MNAIGRYLLFVISLAGMILSDDSFSEQNKKLFLNKLFDLHNMYPTTTGKQLRRSDFLDDFASRILWNQMFDNIYRIPSSVKFNYHSSIYDNNTKLDDALANLIFTKWSVGDIDPADPQTDNAVTSKQVEWENRTDIGLAVYRTNEYYAVLAIYFSLNKKNKEGQLTSNDLKLPTFDQGGSSVI